MGDPVLLFLGGFCFLGVSLAANFLGLFEFFCLFSRVLNQGFARREKSLVFLRFSLLFS